MPPNVLNYMNDYLVATDKDLDKSEGMDTHLDLLDRLFSRLQQADLRLSPSKCSFFQKQADYLGFNFSKERLNMSPKNIRKVEKLQQPKTKKQVRSFLGATGYLRRCIPGYAKIAHPLMHLTKAEIQYIWENRKMMPYQVLNKLLSTK